jgi:hypothetical protein
MKKQCQVEMEVPLFFMQEWQHQWRFPAFWPTARFMSSSNFEYSIANSTQYK